MLSKLKKLRNKSLAEIRGRGVQHANMLAERIGVSPQCHLPPEKLLFDKLNLVPRPVTAASVHEHFRSRKLPSFYPSLSRSGETLAELRKRFPREEATIVGRADKICEGRFDLLGYEDLFFGARIPDWHFEPVSNKTSPRIHWSKIDELDPTVTGDKKIIWELNRHQYFSTLGQAYLLTQDERYAEAWAAHLENWFDNNPAKIGVNWLSSLEIAFRSISWLWAMHFFKESPSFTPGLLVRMLRFLHLNGRHLETYLSTYFSPNTHLTGEALGLYFIGTFLPEFKESARWKETGYRILIDALDFQVRPDGVYCEQSSHYQRYTADFYANLLVLRQLAGDTIEPKLKEKLHVLMDFLMFITQPDGETPLFGDDDGGRFYFFDQTELTDFRPTLALGATLLDRGDLKFAAGTAGPELLWLFGPDGLRKFDSIAAAEPKDTSRAFQDGGFFTTRSSWRRGADCFLIECGPHGFLNGGHAHADALSFILSIDGQPVFIDSGTYNYTSEPAARDRFRSTAAHNCLTVNGESSSLPAGPFSWKSIASARLLEWRDENDLVVFRGTHDGFERLGVSYEREVEFGKDGSFVLSEFINGDRANTYELHFILSPEIDAKIQTDSGRLTLNNRAGRRLLTIDTQVTGTRVIDEGVWRKEQWFVSPRYGAQAESAKLVFSVTAEGELQIRNRFLKAGKKA